MANVKISGLPSATGVADANEFEINESGTSKKVSGTQIKDYVNAGDGALAVKDTVGTADIDADAIDGTKIADDSIDSEHYVDGSIDTDHIAASAVTDAKISGMSSSKLTGALPALDGSSLTGVGKILQVVSNTKHTTSSTTSTSYVATGHTVSITPSSTSSKILIMVHGGNVWNSGTSANMVAQFYVDVAGGGYNAIGSGPHIIVENVSGGAVHKASTSGAYLHSPSTTSTLTYQPYFKVTNSTGYYNEATLGITLTAMEIAG